MQPTPRARVGAITAESALARDVQDFITHARSEKFK